MSYNTLIIDYEIMELWNYEIIHIVAMFGGIVLLNRGGKEPYMLPCTNLPKHHHSDLLFGRWMVGYQPRLCVRECVYLQRGPPACLYTCFLTAWPLSCGHQCKALGSRCHCPLCDSLKGSRPHPTCLLHHHVVMDSLSLASWCLRLAILFGSALNSAYLH